MLTLLIFSFIGLMKDTIGEATMYLTTMDQQQLLTPKVLLASDKVPTNSQVIRLNPSKTFQEMDGFGFTLTGGSAMHLSKMEKGARGKLLKELFGTENEWPSNWQHVHPDTILKDGKWTILRGTLNLAEGKFLLKDSYLEEGGKVKCIRRYEWQGKKTLETVTLAIRWAIPQKEVKPFLPGILYYGNPSGKKNGENNVPWFNGVDLEEALFEEHCFRQFL